MNIQISNSQSHYPLSISSGFCIFSTQDEWRASADCLPLRYEPSTRTDEDSKSPRMRNWRIGWLAPVDARDRSVPHPLIRTVVEGCHF